jgi:hypothetical protein
MQIKMDPSLRWDDEQIVTMPAAVIANFQDGRGTLTP